MNPVVLAAIIAIAADSIVTIVVGVKLNTTAERKIGEGVNKLIEEAPEILAKAMMPKEGSTSGERQS